MATKKDLVEAYSFSRRRLVTAFVSGAPGGREVEPSRPGRTLVGGVAIAVLVAAGAAIGGILGSHTSVDWSQQALISEKETGALYVNLPAQGKDDAPLSPVVNVTSAMLLLGPDPTHTEIPHSEIAKRTPGPLIGILQAPSTPPDPSELIQTGWSACTGSGGRQAGVSVDVTTSKAATTLQPGRAIAVSVGSKDYVVAEDASGQGAYALPVDDSNPINILTTLTGTANTTPVSTDWIGLFPTGAPLGPAGFTGGHFLQQVGQRATYADQIPGVGHRTVKIGDWYRVGNDPSLHLFTPTGVVVLTPFESAVYLETDFPGAKPSPLTGAFGSAPASRAPVSPVSSRSQWPTSTTHKADDGGYCAVLETNGTGPAYDQLAVAPSGSQAAVAPSLAPDQVQRRVDPGHGAEVVSAGQHVLVDDRGIAYQLDPGSLDGNEADAVTQLGYASVKDVDVPDAWLKLFQVGVPLSVSAAQCPPSETPTDDKGDRPTSCTS